MQKRIVIFVGSRANYGRLISVIRYLQANDTFEVKIVGACTLNKVEHDLKLDYYISADMHEDTKANRANTIAIVSSNVSTWLAFNKPDMAIVHGDRFECLGFALACHYAEIPLVHMEAGECTNNDNGTRWAISALADIRIAPTISSYNHLINGGHLNSYFLGSPVIDYLKNAESEIANINYDFVLILYNPVNRHELVKFVSVIEDLAHDEEFKQVKFIWINPNIDPGNKQVVRWAKLLDGDIPNLKFEVNLNQRHFIAYLKSCLCLLGNTSAGIKEGAYLGIPYAYFGNRQGTREMGNNIIDWDIEVIKRFIREKTRFKYTGLFGDGNTSKLLVDVIDDWFDADRLQKLGGLKRCMFMNPE